ncbi:MobF family relaxase [Mycobacterium branderi]|nr:MobF family relaxase [Mycobacterium branderi]MCV7235988.1 relaxase domain-containing protein [Mycobacterium branderi]ORA31255.1 exonuclease V subunit alpha [Mycobacterium branderi]
MGLHKLTAGDGYVYLIRQVAAADDSHRGRPGLADYYSSKGETPGRWMGRGLAGLGRPVSRDPSDPLIAQLWSVRQGSEVTEEQMKALFGEGLHPNAERITKHLTGFGVAKAGAIAAARLGRPFRVNAAENEFIRRLRGAYGDYNATLGRERNTSLDPEVRARIRTAVGRDMFTETHGRAPADERELSGFIARHIRSQTTAVAGYDLTFTPVKSVSALWAIAPRSIATKIEECHHQAVAETLAFIEEHACFSRMGADGIAQVNTTGLIAAVFDHRDSRAGDPNLHTHVAISNKVLAIGPDGIPRWLALDGEPLYKIKVAASEFYNTRIEALLIEKVGVLFAAVAAKAGKRPVREIVGIPTRLLERWSSRRSAIEHRVGQLAKEFQVEHGREPTAVEMVALSQRATLDTRQAKHEPRSLAEQRHMWRGEAIEVVGGQRELTAMIAEVTQQADRQRVAITDKWVYEQAAKVIATVSQTRANWQINHVRAEAQRLLRYTDHVGGPDVVDRIVSAALGDHSIALTSHADTEMGEPAALRRRGGASVYTRHDATVYTGADIMAAERRILAAAGRRGGRVVDDTSIRLALLDHHAKHGIKLNDGQVALVREMATSGARVQLALAPAATGKTTAMAPLAEAWRNNGGTVIGLAATASAAEVLAADLAAPTDTIAKLVQLADPRSGLPASLDDPARKWFDIIDQNTLLIIDEAGMASTLDLDKVIGHALARGASVRLIGDDQQLASISAGGILRDLADRHDVITLSTVVRFTHPDTGQAEGAASLAIRAGDPAGIAFYVDQQRVHVGADAVSKDMAYHAWAADLAAGRDSILLAPTNELVAELNERARLDRLTANPQAASAATVTLADGLAASAGDWIITRKNARWLRATGRGTWVKNGHRWIIRDVNKDGSLSVSPLRGPNTNTLIRLPADYVAAHTTLGYASTINTAQGVTAGGRGIEGTCHIVGSDQLTRQQLYVATTRGSTENHIYFSTSEADPHRIVSPKATHPPTAVDILSAILRRDGAQISAHTAAAIDADPFSRLHRAAAMYADALSAGAEQLAGTNAMARIDAAANAIRPDIADAEAWPVLRRNLAVLAIEGHDPIAALYDAAAAPLGNAKDPAAVLDWRLQPPPGSAAEKVGPLRWLAAIPDPLANDPRWGTYLSARAQLVSELADQVRDIAREWTPATAPAWARPLAGQRPALLAEIAVFRAAHNVDPADTRLTGPEQHANRSAALQHAIHARVDAALTRAHPSAQRWRNLADQLDKHITTDPFWPRLAAHLDEAARAGADVAGLLNTAVSQHGPLPDEMPAAALWWRLAGTLAPATLDRPDTTLRPPWTAELHHLLGTRIAEAVITDPAWPGLVAAVAACGWPPHDILAAATEHLRDIAATQPLRPDEYARLLTYRVELLTHHAETIDLDIPHPAEYADQPTPDEQLHLFTDPDGGDIGDLQVPPPDPYDYPYGFAEEDLGGLDFADLPLHRPTPTQRGDDIDIPALRARRDAARGRAQQLQDAILGGPGGPAEQAAAADLAELRRRHTQQRPNHHALAYAHTDWVRAEDAAELHHQLLNQLGATITAAAQRGDTAAVARYRHHRDQIAQQTPRFDTAVQTARTRLDTARTVLIRAAGGVDNIVTERDIHNRRAAALNADTEALTAARAEALDLDNQLARAEAIAARAFAENPAHNYDLAAELPQLRAEIDFIDAAGRARAAAAGYTTPDETVAHLDQTSRAAVTTITGSYQAVHSLQLHPGADKPAALAAIAAAGHHDNHRVLALPATTEATQYAGANRYADTTSTAQSARDNLETGRWKLPLGSLVVVDDADQLQPELLQWLAENAARTNTKLLLITTSDTREPAHTLLAALNTHLPWAQHLGTPEPSRQRPQTAIERADHHLATTGGTSMSRTEATQLLERRGQLLDHFRELAEAAAQLDATAIADRGRRRGRGREDGIGL